MPSGALQARLNPPTAPRERNVSDAQVNTATPKAIDSTATDQPNFQDLVRNSNAEQARAKIAQKNGDEKGTKTNEQFEKSMRDRLNRENLRVPSNTLDKDAFLQLFITQIQNQDPLNPQESTEMASQLAQFHSLEQMLNVNKNLEKMSGEQATNRAVSLINFVGKEVRIDGGKLRFENGKTSQASYSAERDIPDATLEIRDAAGVIVGTKNLGPIKQGDNNLEFDGAVDNGQLNNGIYTFSIIGKDVNGGDVPVKITSHVKVTGVDLNDNGGSFFTELGKVRIDEVATVGSTATSTNSSRPIANPKEAIPPVSSNLTSIEPTVEGIENQNTTDISEARQASGLAADSAKGEKIKIPLPSQQQVNSEAATDPTSTENSTDKASPPSRNPYSTADTRFLSRPPEPFFSRRI